jgi:SAM-dependent methyltransferase
MEKHLMQLARRHASTPHVIPDSDQAIATAYNQAGDQYLAYADGDASQLFAFGGRYGYGDRKIWEQIDFNLQALHISGAQTVRILDLGCGPGTWLRRVVTRARQLGFHQIVARGFDIAEDQVRRAQELAEPLASQRGVDLRFEVGDICERFPEADSSVDLSLCLCGVLNHLPAHDLPVVLREVARVTRGDFITTVRAIGSMPTVYVGAVEDACTFHQDNLKNRLEVEFRDGRRISLNSHLFSATELRAIAKTRFAIKDIFGLDLFHGRFAEDTRWNSGDGCSTAQFGAELARLEKLYCRDPRFIDRATHLMLVGTRRQRPFYPAAQRTSQPRHHIARP